jgi:hypothetical protein
MHRGSAYLDGQGCLAYAAVAQHHQLVQRHFPRHCEGLGAAGGVQRGRVCSRGAGPRGSGQLSTGGRVQLDGASCKRGATSSQKPSRAGALQLTSGLSLRCRRAGQDGVQRGGSKGAAARRKERWVSWFQTCPRRRARQHRCVLRIAAGASESVGLPRAQRCTGTFERLMAGPCSAAGSGDWGERRGGGAAPRKQAAERRRARAEESGAGRRRRCE